MSFTARFGGPCAGGDRIRPGEEIERTDQPGEFVHVDCVEDYENGITSADEKRDSKRQVCPDCWQVVSASGACGCDE